MNSFYKRFNIPVDLEKAQAKFVNRAIDLVFVNFIRSNPFLSNKDEKIYFSIATYLGIMHVPTWNPHASLQYYAKIYTKQDFNNVLQGTEAIDLWLTSNCPSRTKIFRNLVEEILNVTEVGLGIIWRNGKFYPSGAKVLDEALVNDVLNWLDEDRFTNVKAPFQKALSHYLESTKKPELLADVITDMYEALEAFAMVVTGKDKDLSANKDLLIKKLKLGDIYKKMLKDYISYACEYRHGLNESENRTIPKEQEVEAFIYQTGLYYKIRH